MRAHARQVGLALLTLDDGGGGGGGAAAGMGTSTASPRGWGLGDSAGAGGVGGGRAGRAVEPFSVVLGRDETGGAGGDGGGAVQLQLQGSAWSRPFGLAEAGPAGGQDTGGREVAVRLRDSARSAGPRQHRYVEVMARPALMTMQRRQWRWRLCLADVDGGDHIRVRILVAATIHIPVSAGPGAGPGRAHGLLCPRRGAAAPAQQARAGACVGPGPAGHGR
jgi:hypothetical protein